MDRSLIIRAAGLYLPISAAVLLWMWRRPPTLARAALLLAALWNFEALIPVSRMAERFGWWSFHVHGGTFLGIPVDLLLGWSVLWGIVAVLAAPEAPVALVALACLALDLIFMPRLAPVVTLGRHWLAGEAVAIAFALIPSLWLARWTSKATHLYARASMQVLVFSALTVFLLPAVILTNSHGEWERALQRPFWMTGLWLQGFALIAIMGLSAVQEFAVRGGGTPLPYDPPRRLVTSGPYAYIANPMQLSAVLILAALGWWLGSWWVAASGVMAHIYSAGLAAWDEKGDLSRRFGLGLEQYRVGVRAWIPRWRPFVATDGGSSQSRFVVAEENTSGIALGSDNANQCESACAKLYVAEQCGPCSEVKRWFESRRASGLEVVAAECFPGGGLTRVTYVSADGYRAEGVAALARGLEHIHLGWALLGFAVRLPGVCATIQLLADASGAGPRTIDVVQVKVQG